MPAAPSAISEAPIAPLPPHFDPRRVPVAAIDDHLPAVAADQQTPEALRRRFAMPPHWQPEVVRERLFTQRTPALAAVLVPIVLHARPTVLLTERTQSLSTHSGQIAFPGGRTDPHDRDAVATALREAQEEVGLAPAGVEVLGRLPIYATSTSFIVTPVVALVQPGMVLHPNPDEVADVFEVPLDFLLNPAHHHHHVMQWQGQQREWLSMPYDDGRHTRFIWGATAGMLRNFYRFMRA